MRISGILVLFATAAFAGSVSAVSLNYGFSVDWVSGSLSGSRSSGSFTVDAVRRDPVVPTSCVLRNAFNGDADCFITNFMVVIDSNVYHFDELSELPADFKKNFVELKADGTVGDYSFGDYRRNDGRPLQFQIHTNGGIFSQYGGTTFWPASSTGRPSIATASVPPPDIPPPGAEIPEPAILPLLLAGLLFFFCWHLRRRTRVAL